MTEDESPAVYSFDAVVDAHSLVRDKNGNQSGIIGGYNIVKFTPAGKIDLGFITCNSRTRESQLGVTVELSYSDVLAIQEHMRELEAEIK